MRALNRFDTESEWAESELEYPDTSAVEEDFSMRFLVNPDDFVFEVSGGSTLALDIVSGGTGETTVNVVSTQHGENVGFMVSEKPDWVSITMGETSFTYQVPSNPDTVERSGNMRLVQEGSGNEITISFRQAEGVFYEFNISGETSHSLSLDGEASSGSINVTSTKNGSLLGYSVSGTPSWMTANRSSSNNVLSYSVTDNYGGSQRSGVLNLVQDETSSRITVNISQEYATIQATAAQIVLWDASGETKLVVDDYNTSNYPTSRYTPIGVVVIPSSHMDDGRARMMSLKWMSCNDPENGSITYDTMVWGTDTDLTGLTNFTQVPILSSATNQTVSGVNVDGYLSSDYSEYTGTSNPQDPGTKWYSDENIRYIASPYASDGTPNPNYRATSYSGGSINNALSYFDGRHQSDVILAARGEKDYTSWKPGSGTPEDFPAASCCDMYHTIGTSQGDWYLPSCAELGYIVARLNDINNVMTKVNGMQNLPSYWAWSSSECGSSLARRVGFSSGGVGYWGRKESRLGTVVAFCPV